MEGMRWLSTKARAWIHDWLLLLFPPACVFCGAPVKAQRSACDECALQVQVVPPYACRRCGRSLPEELAPGPCGQCLQHPPIQRETHSLYLYQGPVRTAILAWKLSHKDAGVRWLIQAARPALQRRLHPNSLLIPIPMPLSRMRQRGHHHTAELCKWIAEITGCQWEWRLLKRKGEQPPQSSLPAAERRKNVRDAFHVDPVFCKKIGKSCELWIVDDVITTGSTVHYAAKALMPLFRDILVLTLAKTPDQP